MTQSATDIRRANDLRLTTARPETFAPWQRTSLRNWPGSKPVNGAIHSGRDAVITLYHTDHDQLSASRPDTGVTRHPLGARAIEIGRNGTIVTSALHDALRQLIRQCRDVRLSLPLGVTLALLDRGLSDQEVADRLHRSKRTIEEHKRKILELFGDLVNDQPGHRPARGLIRRALSWLATNETKSKRHG